jgi:hypothetical protein
MQLYAACHVALSLNQGIRFDNMILMLQGKRCANESRSHLWLACAFQAVSVTDCITTGAGAKQASNCAEIIVVKIDQIAELRAV